MDVFVHESTTFIVLCLLYDDKTLVMLANNPIAPFAILSSDTYKTCIGQVTTDEFIRLLKKAIHLMELRVNLHHCTFNSYGKDQTRILDGAKASLLYYLDIESEKRFNRHQLQTFATYFNKWKGVWYDASNDPGNPLCRKRIMKRFKEM